MPPRLCDWLVFAFNRRALRNGSGENVPIVYEKYNLFTQTSSLLVGHVRIEINFK